MQRSARVCGALRVGFPARYPCCLRGCARAAPRTPSGRPGSKGRRAAGQSPTASPDAVVQGRGPRRAAGSSGRRTRRLGRPGVLRPVTYCPPGRPPCRPPPGNFADSRAGQPAGPGMAPAQGPCPGGKDQEPCGSGAMLPKSGPNRQQPALPTGAGGAPAACSAKATVTTGRPAPARCSPDRRPAARLLAMTGRSGHQPSPPPGMSCPSRPAVPAWPFRLAGPASWTCTRNIPSRPASETARPQRLAERAEGVIRRTAAAMDRGGTAERPGVLPGMLPHRPARHG
jgi:hypothetical protein